MCTHSLRPTGRVGPGRGRRRAKSASEERKAGGRKADEGGRGGDGGGKQ